MKNKLKKAVVFDFDGTITNSMPTVNYCMVKAMQYVGSFSVDENTVSDHYGPTERGIISSIVPPGNEDKAWAKCLEIYKEKAKEIQPYDGIIDVFKFLINKGIQIFLVTGRSRETLDISLKEMNLSSYFINTYSGSDLGTNKETSIETLLKDYSLNKEEIVYIGDTLDDIRMMRNISVDIISVSYSHDKNYHKQLEEKNHGMVVSSIKDLKDKLSIMIDD